MLTKLKLLLLPCLLVVFINSCSSEESTSEGNPNETENPITDEAEVEEIVEGIVEEEMPENEIAEEVVDVIVEEVIEEEVTDKETIEEITEEVVEETTGGETEEVTEEETTEEPVVTVENGAVSKYGKLQVNGNQITSGNTGEVVQLRGMSLFWSQWSDGAIFYDENTVKYLVDEFNVNIVRAAIGVDAGDGGYVSSTTAAQRETQKAFAVIRGAIENDIYVIVDWHSHFAHLNDRSGQYKYAKQFFTDVYNEFGNVPNNYIRTF